MAIIIERTITIKNDQATLDKPIYFYVGDGNITCIFTINEKEKTASFGRVIDKNVIEVNDSLDYGEARIYKPDKDWVLTSRGEIFDNRLKVDFNWDYMDNPAEAGRHQLQIHLYDNNVGDRNRLTIPPIDLYVLLPIGVDTTLIDKALVGYSFLDSQDEEIPTFDENGNYNMTVWKKGDIITQDKLNKLEEALRDVTAADDDFITNEGLEIALASKANAEHTHTTNDIPGLARVATTGSYNDLSNKPNMASYATKADLANKSDRGHSHSDYATRNELSSKSDKGHGHGEYALKTEIPKVPTRLGELINDKAYITSAEIPANYVTNSILESYNYATENYVNGNFATQDYVKNAINRAVFPEAGELNIDLSAYALKSEVPSRTSQLFNNSGYITDDTLNKKGYATTSFVTDTVKEEIKNVKVDLSNYPTNEDMNNALSGKANNEHSHDGQYALDDHNHIEEYDTRYLLRGEVPENIPTKESDLEPDRGYVTGDTVNESINRAVTGINNNLANYALKEDIPKVPTKESDLEPDRGYAKEADVNEIINNVNQNLISNYINKDDMPTKVSQFENDKGYITEENIPTNVSAFTNDAEYVTQDNLDSTLSGYAYMSDIPTNTSQLTNNSGFITSGQNKNGEYSIKRIEIVEMLPTYEEPGVLYIVRA